MGALLISPHLDDAALSCARRIKNGDVACVTTVFAGLPPPGTPLSDWDRITRARDARTRVRERRAEDSAAWRSIGVDFHHADLAEAQAGEIDRVRLRRVIAASASGFTQVLVPAGIGRHPHHMMVRDAAIEVLPATAGIILYGEIPYAAYFGWPGSHPFLDVHSYWANELRSLASPPGPARVMTLDAEERAWKRRLLAHYPSQMGAVGGGSLALLESAMLDCELEFHLT